MVVAMVMRWTEGNDVVLCKGTSASSGVYVAPIDDSCLITDEARVGSSFSSSNQPCLDVVVLTESFRVGFSGASGILAAILTSTVCLFSEWCERAAREILLIVAWTEALVGGLIVASVNQTGVALLNRLQRFSLVDLSIVTSAEVSIGGETAAILNETGRRLEFGVEFGTEFPEFPDLHVVTSTQTLGWVAYGSGTILNGA